jgi:hypothetical protein
MRANCPPRYLRRELAVLQPAARRRLRTLEAWDAVERIGRIEESVGGADFSRSVVRLDDLAFDMTWLHHPSTSGGRWQRSFELLLGNLAQNPVRPVV